MSARFQFVTGKGGVGKSSLAAALALRAAQAGQKPLLVELSGRRSIATMFGVAPSARPRAAHGIHIMQIDRERALADFIPAGLRRVARVEAFRRFAKAAPAVEEVLTLSVLQSLGRQDWDPILVDLDATGHARMFLSLPEVFAALPVGGPLRRLLQDFTASLSKESELHLITRPAALPVRETLELLDFVDRAELRLGKVIVNRMPLALFEEHELAELRSERNAQVQLAMRSLQLRRLAERDLAPLLERTSVHACVSELTDANPLTLASNLVPMFDSVRSDQTTWGVDHAFDVGENAPAPSNQAIESTRSSDGPCEVDGIVQDASLVVCLGTGGVGKTTASAALALRAAQLRRRTLVLTVDPAKRLADALGLRALDDTVQSVDGVEGLFASMLDTKAGYDALIRRIAGEGAAPILENVVYTIFSKTLARSHAYVAVERLYEVMEDPRFDLVVLDTPPARSALEILDAPRTLSAFLEQDILKPFLDGDRGASLGARITRASGRVALAVLSRLTGGELVDALTDFLRVLADQRTGFEARARANDARLRDPLTSYVLVTAAEETTLADAESMLHELRARVDQPASVLFNRFAIDGTSRQGDGALESPPFGQSMRARLDWNQRYFERIAAQRTHRVRTFLNATSSNGFALCEQIGEVRTLDGLARLIRSAASL